LKDNHASVISRRVNIRVAAAAD